MLVARAGLAAARAGGSVDLNRGRAGSGAVLRRGRSGRDTTGFSSGLRRARLDQIVNDPQFSRWFAGAYVGID
jgi:hypothetical protein